MKRSRRVAVFAPVSVLAILLVAACGGSSPGNADGPTDTPPSSEGQDTAFPPNSTMGKIQEKGHIVVGTKFSAPPFGFKNPNTNQVEGFAPDVSKVIADKLGVEVKFVEETVDNRIQLLQKGATDLSVDTMVITCERLKEIDFSRPYYLSQARILTSKDSGLESLSDLNGKTISTPVGSYMIPALKEAAPQVELEYIDDYAQMFELLQQGKIDGITTDDTILTGMIIQDSNMHLIGEPLGEGPYGIGVAQDKTDLLDFVNETLDEMLQDGSWEEIYQTWIGKYTGEKPTSPVSTTLEDAIKLNPCE